MPEADESGFADLSLETPVWERFFTVAPLVAYLSPGRYAEISSGCTFPLPAGFKA